MFFSVCVHIDVFPSFGWGWVPSLCVGSPTSGWLCVLLPVMVPEAVPPPSRLVLLLRSGFLFSEPGLCVGVSSVCFSCVFLRDVVTLWVKSVFVTLDRERRIILVVLPF